MCLVRLSEEPKKLKTYHERVGWKIFYYAWDDKTLRFLVFKFNNASNVPRDKWLHETTDATIDAYVPNFREYGHRRRNYKPRFHIYLKRPAYSDSDSVIVKKVRWKGPVATGFQNGLPVVVATWLLVGKKNGLKRRNERT